MNFDHRLAVYGLIALVWGAYNIVAFWFETERRLVEDPSAGAIWGFMVFLFPIFWALPIIVTTGVATVIELAWLVYKWVK